MFYFFIFNEIFINAGGNLKIKIAGS